jgi:UDP-2-acetamido-3-amino-2,3-dideoxy-glucuronate N-acetyltransferase
MPDYFAHETAIIDANVQIGAGTKIWHFSHVLSGTAIGERCSFGQNCVVGPRVKMGNGIKVQNNVSVYEGVEVEDDCFLGPSMVFTNVFNPRAFIERKDEYRRTLLRCGCTIGANATVVCGVTLGRYCLIGAGSLVRTDVPDFALMVGVPAKQIGWVSRAGNRLSFDAAGSAKDEFDGTEYQLRDGAVAWVAGGPLSETEAHSESNPHSAKVQA